LGNVITIILNTTAQSGLWNAPLVEEGKSIALQAEIKNLKKSSKKDPQKPFKERDTVKYKDKFGKNKDTLKQLEKPS
jgi:hypothetical protein